jgi:hypothetical protein
MAMFMPAYSIEELKRIVRRMEFNKTEPELLIELINKAVEAGEGERIRLKNVNKKSHELLHLLNDRGFFHQIKEDEEVEELKKVPLGALDGSFQIVGGVGGRWYVMIGVAQVIAESGFTLRPTIVVDGSIEPLDTVDESEVSRLAEITMMLGEIKALRKMAEKLRNKRESYVLIDGPIIDPPTYYDKKYVEERVSALQLCHEGKINVIGFVKRVMGRSLLNRLSEELGEDLSNFTNDLDLLSTIMFNAVKDKNGPVYTRPMDYGEGNCLDKKVALAYSVYKDMGLQIYCSYYKPSLRGRIFRVEYASFKPLEEQELLEKFRQVMCLINRVWTLPGMDEPLPIIIAHNKCNVRRGAAETIYYEIMTRALYEGDLHFWLEGLSRV